MEGENDYLINLTTLKSHHFQQVDSKLPSWLWNNSTLFYECVKILATWNLNLYDLELLEGWGDVNPGKKGRQ